MGNHAPWVRAVLGAAPMFYSSGADLVHIASGT